MFTYTLTQTLPSAKKAANQRNQRHTDSSFIVTTTSNVPQLKITRECPILHVHINFFYSGIAAGSLRFAKSLNALGNEDDFQGSKQVLAKRKFKIKGLVKLPGQG